MSVSPRPSTAPCIQRNGSSPPPRPPVGAAGAGAEGGETTKGVATRGAEVEEAEAEAGAEAVGAEGRRTERQPWTDDRHPRIAAMMKDYANVRGYRIKLTDILDGANKRITFIANGRPYVCWTHILGRCTFDNCQFKNGHVPRSAIPDTFAEKVVTMLTPGVKAVVARDRDQDGSPTKGQRTEGWQA